MRVIWSDLAISSLYDIYKYFKQAAGETVANRIKSRIFTATRQLNRHPESGQIEPILKQLGENHRYLIKGNYKIIYKKVIDGILITDVFDSSQDLKKMINKKNKPRR